MAYQLIHHFDPDFDHFHLTPRMKNSGKVDHYNLGYAQNVVAGQVLAELIPEGKPLPEGIAADTVRMVDMFPAGPNTAPNPSNPFQLVATATGYVFYNEDLITVKRLLNIRRDVDFHTGNVVFVSDVCVHGSVRTGFSVQGKRILVKGTVEGAHITARENIESFNGVKGSKQALLDAGGNIRVPFVENAEMRAKGKILITGSCMHSDIWAGNTVVIKGRLQGGTLYANHVVYIEDQLGGGVSTVTSIVMGYDPFRLHELKSIDNQLEELGSQEELLAMLCRKSDRHRQEHGPKLENVRTRRQAFLRRRDALWTMLEKEHDQTKARIVVPGRIRPKVEISIGGAHCVINDFMENVCIYLQDNEIVFDSPAAIKK